MSYKVLYRKYRPNCFNELIGQDNIKETLKNSIINNKISHAYIFTGPRGTGKTSTAKILAKALNCTNTNKGEPCQKCINCENFSNSPDIIEIDAASNNGVDEIRELRNNITLAPAQSKYKIYIIDEVHMLSTGAFNALLKTLEEPPDHVIFILATTEVYKVPITILSRCQRFDFKKIDKDKMKEYLKYVCEEEKIEYEQEIFEEIYALSEGCMRDALSILDQTSKIDGKLTINILENNYSLISNKDIFLLLDSIENGDVNTIVEKINKYKNSGLNPQKLIKKLINNLEEIAINIKLKLEKRYDFKKIITLIKSMNNCYTEARINENIYTLILIAFLELIDNDESKKDESSTQKIKTKTNGTSEVKDESVKNIEYNILQIRINNCFTEANKNALNKYKQIWKKIKNIPISGLNLNEYEVVAASEKYIIIATEEESLANLLNIRSVDIEKEFSKNGYNVKIVALSKNKWNAEKNTYITNLKNNIAYKLIEEPTIEDGNKMIKDKINKIFENEKIEIN